ncbi:ORF6N domain-containing protein [Limnobaculum xujianqingii]|uniref:ORF6N domain-containing protein n=1 Tax=Limnobaculum xujianqingii TaxID=2738837 RepID=UPI001127648D|nr:ORF6N domain-containing protein [Limnobaculum xujianqingii]
MNTQLSTSNLSIVTHNQAPVITTELLAQLYGSEVKHIQNNHIRNEDRFVSGKHFFKLEGAELRDFKNRPSLRGLVGKHARSLILWTERGAARHAKMLETDQAWEVFEKLEDCYFNQRQPQLQSKPKPRTPDYRYNITLIYRDNVTGLEERFSGVCNTHEEIIRGTAKKFGIFIPEMINMPFNAY